MTCIAVYPVPQSKYRIGSPLRLGSARQPLNLFRLTLPLPPSFALPRASLLELMIPPHYRLGSTVVVHPSRFGVVPGSIPSLAILFSSYTALSMQASRPVVILLGNLLSFVPRLFPRSYSPPPETLQCPDNEKDD
jgi:hypothetical protein